MGVMRCFRKGCENIMCDRYSSQYGYICHECYEELEMTKPVSIKSFMESEKEKKMPEYYGDIFILKGELWKLKNI